MTELYVALAWAYALAVVWLAGFLTGRWFQEWMSERKAMITKRVSPQRPVVRGPLSEFISAESSIAAKGGEVFIPICDAEGCLCHDEDGKVVRLPMSSCP